MIEQDILRMKPGIDLNLAVAQEVMGHVVINDESLGYMERFVDNNGGSVWNVLQSYSENSSLAELVVDKMIQEGHHDAVYWSKFGYGAYTEAEAICKAAILAVMKRRNIDKIIKQAFGEANQGK